MMEIHGSADACDSLQQAGGAEDSIAFVRHHLLHILRSVHSVPTPGVNIYVIMGSRLREDQMSYIDQVRGDGWIWMTHDVFMNTGVGSVDIPKTSLKTAQNSAKYCKKQAMRAVFALLLSVVDPARCQPGKHTQSGMSATEVYSEVYW